VLGRRDELAGEFELRLSSAAKGVCLLGTMPLRDRERREENQNEQGRPHETELYLDR
jgi:hypothetical protein